MDAASAAAMACCMLQPQSTGIGGYVCCAVVCEGKSDRIWSIDSNSHAPAAAHEGMFDTLPPRRAGDSPNEHEYFCRVKHDANMYGPLAVGTPGMMAGMGIVWERWGRLKWSDIIAPSQELLADGFPFGTTAKAIAEKESVIRRFPATAAHLLPNGKLPSPDDHWHRPDMEKTLQRIVKAGWRDFYQGEMGHKIADCIQGLGGILTRQDLESFEPRITDAISTTYRNATVYGPVLTNGCLTVLQVLNMLESLEINRNEISSIRSETTAYWHGLIEVLKLAWHDRLRYLGDPDYVDVPVERLLSKDYAAERVEAIRRFPDRVVRVTPAVEGEPVCETSHVSTADAEGNLVAMTITHGGAFGSNVTVPDTGIILGHGMFRFDPRPGRANSVRPRKRPLNNTACMIVRLPNRDVATGLNGGRRIICVMPRIVQLLADHGVTGREAAVAPRLHVELSEPVEITEDAGHDTIAALRAMGHEMKPAKTLAGDVNCAEVLKDEGIRAGGSASAAGV
jgi:gamma-glutamyltranspeptidase/glutathione hydrolase